MSAKASVTTIYLTSEQKRHLMTLAKQSRSTFSQQVRDAIDRYLKQPPSAMVDEQQMAHLAQAANQAITRMSAKLDEAHAAVRATVRALSARGR